MATIAQEVVGWRIRSRSSPAVRTTAATKRRKLDACQAKPAGFGLVVGV